MVEKSVSDTIGPERLRSAVVVFGSTSRPAIKIPAEMQISRKKRLLKL